MGLDGGTWGLICSLLLPFNLPLEVSSSKFVAKLPHPMSTPQHYPHWLVDWQAWKTNYVGLEVGFYFFAIKFVAFTEAHT